MRPLFDEGGSESASAVSRDYGFDLGLESGGLGAWRTPRARLGHALGMRGDLFEREVEYLVGQKWASTPDDVL